LLVLIDEQLYSARRNAFKQGMLDCEAGTLDLLVSKATQDMPMAMVMELKVFNTAAGINSASGRIPKILDASKFLNHTLLEKLYEAGQ